jgi:hypothetical protein
MSGVRKNDYIFATCVSLPFLVILIIHLAWANNLPIRRALHQIQTRGLLLSYGFTP